MTVRSGSFKRRFTMRAVALYATAFFVLSGATVAIAQGIIRDPSGTTTCGNVSNTSTTVLAANQSGRNKWGIVTTSGAGAIHFEMGTPATKSGGLPLSGGSSYIDEGPLVYSGVVTAIKDASGNTWVCTYEL